MRLTSAIWVSAYIRRLSIEGIPVLVVRRGAEEAGAIFVKVNRLNGTADVYAPAPQTAFDDDHPGDRLWTRATGPDPIPDDKAEEYLAKQARFDSDLWVLEVEARDGDQRLDVIDF